MMIVLGNGRGDQLIQHEAASVVQHPAHGGHIPNDTAPYTALGVFVGGLHRVLHQIIAQGVLALEPMVQLRLGGGEGADHAHAGQHDQRRARAKHHAGRGHVLRTVEFNVIMPFQRVAAQPDHHDAIRDFRLHQQGGGHVGNRADRQHIQRLFRAILHGQLRKVLRRVGRNRGLLIGQIAVRAAIYRALQPGELQQLQNFLIAALHAVRGAAGTIVEERRGVERPHVQLFLCVQCVGNRELVVDFVIRIGIQNHIHRARRDFQILEALFHRKHIHSSISCLSISKADGHQRSALPCACFRL